MDEFGQFLGEKISGWFDSVDFLNLKKKNKF